MEQSYNLRSPAVKRLMREAKELHEATSEYCAKPLEDNLFEWHFTFRGPSDSEFEGGYYHGRIILPPEYPMKPPSIMLLTPNGRFELNKKICLSISGYHPESWQPSWSIRTAILAIIGFMPTKGEGAIGALDYTPEERKVLARKSQAYCCQTCGPICDLLPKDLLKDEQQTTENEAEKRDRELAKQIMFAKPKESPATSKRSEENSSETDSSGNSQISEEISTNGRGEVDGIRQRVVSSAVDEGQQPTQSAGRTSSSPSQHRNNETTSLMLVVIISVAIVVLFFRRLERIYNISSNFMQ